MARCILLTWLGFPLLAGLGFPVLAQAQPPDEDQRPLLYNTRNFDGWFKYTSNKAVDTEKLILREPFEHYIIIKGTAPGYLITEKAFSDYELTLEYRWNIHQIEQDAKPIEVENLRSGVLFHIASEGDAIWHKCIKAQLRPERGGDLQLLNGFKLDVHPDRHDPNSKTNFLRSHDGCERPMGEWNHLMITCHGKFVTLTMNDTKVMTARNAEVSKGRIALQSEYGEIHFRNIRLKPLEGRPIDPDIEP